MKEIETRDVSAAGSNDAGDLFEIECPECGSTVRLTSGSAWWDTKCSCGHKWKLTLVAKGYKEE